MRLKRALGLLDEKGIECGIVLKPENIFYLTDFFPSTTSVLLLKPDPLLLLSKMDSTRIEGLEVEFKVVERFKEELKALKYKMIGVEKEYISLDFYEKYLKGKKIKDLNIEKMRSVKDDEEVENIKKAIRIAEGVLEEVALEGKTEKEVATALEYKIREKADTAFDAIVASGRNSSIPHHKPTGRRIRRGDAVVIDIGARFNHYNCDISRTFSLEAGREFNEVYEAVLQAQEAGIAECYEGNKIKEADDAVRGVLREYGLEDSSLHSSGHGVGLEVHEEPRIGEDAKGKFKKGMVVTLEPGIYKDFGVRIEDMVLVGRKPKILTGIKK
jgi:Xaa-Pro dipeptidase